jgi:hypothetical protein
MTAIGRHLASHCAISMMRHSVWFLGNSLRPTVLAAVTALALLVAGAAPLHAQPPTSAEVLSQEELDELRGHMDVFSNVLKEGLGLNARAGVFVPRQGDVRGRYLAGQGVMLEIMSPLQGSRSTVSAQAVNSAFQDLSAQLNNLMTRGAMMRPDLDAMRETMALSLRSDEVAEFYREQLLRLSAIDDFSAIDRVLATASSSVQGLHTLEEIDTPALQELSEQLRVLRSELMLRVEQANTLRREMREQSQRTDTLPDEETRARWQQARETLQDQLAQLHVDALAQAGQLRARNEEINARREAQWQQDVQAFELLTFAALCDYAAGLRALPDRENITVVLAGLGDASSDGGRRDKVHVVSKQNLMSCQRGDIDSQVLRSRAVSYSF